MNLNRKTILSLGSALVALGVMSVAGYGCGDDDTATTGTDSGPVVQPEAGPGTDSSPGVDSSTPNPAPPALGAQIDRLGRPAINTALTATFETDAGTKGAKKDAYNADNNPAHWATNIPEQAGNLAIFDSLDTNCGNQFLAMPDAGGKGTSASNVEVYGTLASITADDRIWLNTAGTACTTYLAVEANYAATAGLIPATFKNADCGGRALPYDVIDITYSVVAVGNVQGVTDGVSADATKTAATAFPYLAAPTQ